MEPGLRRGVNVDEQTLELAIEVGNGGAVLCRYTLIRLELSDGLPRVLDVGTSRGESCAVILAGERLLGLADRRESLARGLVQRDGELEYACRLSLAGRHGGNSARWFCLVSGRRNDSDDDGNR